VIHPSDLQKYSLFGGLMAAQIDEILPLLEQESYKTGDKIIVEGSLNEKIRFIIEGRVEAEKQSVYLCDFKEGDAFGEMEVLDVMPAAATIRAVVPTTVMSFSNRTLRQIYRMDIKAFSLIIMNLARELSRRLRQMDSTFAEAGRTAAL
jgi:CRP-like cAMP-binding protein